ncbi:hypothetical protein L6164_030479 [Bauhinia variegata]|uniref:Uncharacterized protein n=1 Tax=Bauhinia variegata TaxID=167791 RepID=A0ACB9LCK1_BAUVA|nr:hypothetical protein L6164_030479 [Bauhinia variegata]
MAQILSCTTAAEIWKNLHDSFACSSRANVMELRLQLQTTKKCNLSMWEYILKFRHTCDNLRAIGEGVTDDDQIMAILGGLGSEYNPIVASVAFESISAETLQSHLLRG